MMSSGRLPLERSYRKLTPSVPSPSYISDERYTELNLTPIEMGREEEGGGGGGGVGTNKIINN